MQHLTKSLATTIHANIIRLINKKSNNILRNRNQQHDNKRNFDSNNNSKRKSQHNNKEKFKFLNKEYIREIQYVNLITTN